MSKPQKFFDRQNLCSVKRKQTLKSEAAQEIAESMLEIGQQTTIHVRADEDRIVPVERLHRLEACKPRGEETIIGLLVSAEATHQKTLSPLEADVEAKRQKMARLRKYRLEKEPAEKSAVAAREAMETVPPATPTRTPGNVGQGQT